MQAQLGMAIVAAFLAGAPVVRALAAEGRPRSFAVVPQGPPETMRAMWLPVVERLSARSGVPLELVLHAKVEDFQDDLAAGKLDLVYANPVQAIRARRAVGYRPLVRDATMLRGIFVVAADSPFTTLDSLAGREVAMIGPWTFCSVSLRAHTDRLGIVPRFVGTPASATKSVLLGVLPAGGMLDSALADLPPEVRAKLRVVHETPPMAPHAVIAHPRVPAEDAGKITAAFLALARSDAAALLAPLHLGTPVEAAYARDYAPLEFLLDVRPYPAPADAARRAP